MNWDNSTSLIFSSLRFFRIRFSILAASLSIYIQFCFLFSNLNKMKRGIDFVFLLLRICLESQKIPTRLPNFHRLFIKSKMVFLICFRRVVFGIKLSYERNENYDCRFKTVGKIGGCYSTSSKRKINPRRPTGERDLKIVFSM